MLRQLFLKTLNKYASRWLVLGIDVFLVSFSFVLAYIVRFDVSFNFNTESFYHQLPVIFTLALFSFLLVGSYKGIIRHTGTKDVFNVFEKDNIINANLSIQLNLEAIIAEIDTKHSNTGESEKFTEYQNLREMNPTLLLQEFKS